MGERNRKIIRALLIMLSVLGAAGYGVSTWMGGRNHIGEDISIAESSVKTAWETGESQEEDRLKGTQEAVNPKEAAVTQNQKEQMSRGKEAPKAREGSVIFEYTDFFTAVPGLSEETAGQIEKIHNGEPLAEATGIEGLDKFYALIVPSGIIGRDRENGEFTGRGGEVAVYVPNLIKGLEEVSVLFYGRESQKWEVIEPKEVAPEAKTVTVPLPEAGILTVIYKRE